MSAIIPFSKAITTQGQEITPVLGRSGEEGLLLPQKPVCLVKDFCRYHDPGSTTSSAPSPHLLRHELAWRA